MDYELKDLLTARAREIIGWVTLTALGLVLLTLATSCTTLGDCQQVLKAQHDARVADGWVVGQAGPISDSSVIVVYARPAPDDAATLVLEGYVVRLGEDPDVLPAELTARGFVEDRQCKVPVDGADPEGVATIWRGPTKVVAAPPQGDGPA